MKSSFFLQMIILLPFAGFVFAGRTVWMGILAVLAGLGVVSARSEGNPGNWDTSEMVKCYKQVIVRQSLMTDPRWMDSDLLNKWAMAERNVIKCLLVGQTGYDMLEDWVEVANKASEAAQAVVSQGLLSGEAYGMACRILDEWHCDVVTSYGGVKCYDRTVTPPAVGNAANRLDTLASLRKQGTLDSQAIAEVEAGIQSDLKGTESADVAEEVSSFLMDLLGYNK
jgi:hypothetical protein